MLTTVVLMLGLGIASPSQDPQQVDEAFYRAVQPTYCLWPTPRWLWENDSGAGKGSGPWDTLNVRDWMSRLNIRRHYVAADGLHRID